MRFLMAYILLSSFLGLQAHKVNHLEPNSAPTQDEHSYVCQICSLNSENDIYNPTKAPVEVYYTKLKYSITLKVVKLKISLKTINQSNSSRAPPTS